MYKSIFLILKVCRPAGPRSVGESGDVQNKLFEAQKDDFEGLQARMAQGAWGRVEGCKIIFLRPKKLILRVCRPAGPRERGGEWRCAK